MTPKKESNFAIKNGNGDVLSIQSFPDKKSQYIALELHGKNKIILLAKLINKKKIAQWNEFFKTFD